MEHSSGSIPHEPHGVRVGGVGGAILTLMFFLPWFSACNVNLTGKDLAFGLELDMGLLGSTSGAPVYPWVALVLLCGLAGLGILILSLMRALGSVRQQAMVLIAPGALACGLLAIVLIGYLRENSQSGVTVIRMEYGLPGSIVGAALMLGGALYDLRQPTAVASRDPRVGAPTPPPPPTLPNVPVHSPPPLAAVTLSAGSRASIGKLRCVKGVLQGQVFDLSPDRTTIGRSSDNAICLRDTQVSRLHAVIRQAQGVFFLQDQESTQGTLLNSQPVQASALHPGDQITIGESVFEFVGPP